MAKSSVVACTRAPTISDSDFRSEIPESKIEFDSLRQRQRIRPVDRIGLSAHVDLPCVGAGFTAAAGFLFAAERAADLGTRGADVDVGDAAVGTGRRKEALGRLHIVGEDG